MVDEANVEQYNQQPELQMQEQKSVEQPVKEAAKEKEADAFRAMRERTEAAERKAQEYERMILAAQQQQQVPKPTQHIEEDDIDISDDTYIEGKQFKRYVKGLKQEIKAAKEQFKEMQQQNSLSTAELRLQSQFNDFTTVVNEDNLKKLASLKPALYRSIMANQDIYDRGYTAYELIRSSIIPDQQKYAEADKRLDENRAKPRSAANVAPQVGESPLTRVGDYDRRVLTKERKDFLMRQVEEAKRNL